jgi:LDH2 family malate/lactate/ureidoglycolate dehydrogenase
MTNYVAVRAQMLSLAVARALHGIGSNATEARLIADNLVLANLSGHDYPNSSEPHERLVYPLTS